MNVKHLAVILLLTLPFFSFKCGKEVFSGKREARGVWMSRFEYTNDSLRNNPDAAKAHIREVFEKARRARFNMVIFQVRGNGSSFYRSDYEPWALELTGTLGTDPGWDPLQFALDEAHRLGLELHAWINTFPIWRGGIPPIETSPRQPYLAHPEWVVCDKDGKPMRVEPPSNEYVWASPGNPEARRHVLTVVMDIVRKYDVDGIHFDYIRYPEGSPARGYSHDPVSVARFSGIEGNPHQLSWEHWQREQVNEFVFEAYNAATAVKPWVKMSAAVIGKYTGEGWNSYSVVYQDPRRWMEVGKIDFIVPMVYWERTHPTHPFLPLITQWQDRVAYDRYVLPGLSAGLIRKFGWEEIAGEIEEVRSRGLPGVVFFAAGSLEQSWDVLGMDEFPHWSLVPAMTWKDSIPPAPPKDLRAQAVSEGIKLDWVAPPSDEPLFYIVYRSRAATISASDVENIATVTGRNVTSVLLPHALADDRYFAVASLDRLANESALSGVVKVERGTVAADVTDNELRSRGH